MNRKLFLLNAPNNIQTEPIIAKRGQGNFSHAPGFAVKALPDGKRALSSGLDFHLRLWDLEEGTCLKSWNAYGPLFSIETISDGTIALLGAVQGIVCFNLDNWDLCQQNTFWSHSLIHSVAYSESTGELLGGSEDSTIHRWHFPSKEKSKRLVGHKANVTAMEIDQSGRIAISGDLYGILRLWELGTYTCLHEWQGHDKKVSSVDMSSDGRLVLTGGEDGDIILWDLQKAEAILKLQDRWVRDVILSKDASWALSCSDDGVSFWDLTEKKLLGRYEGESIKAISLSPDESILVALVKSNHILVWENQSI